MTRTFVATYEGKGVLRLEKGLDLPSRTRVRVTGSWIGPGTTTAISTEPLKAMHRDQAPVCRHLIHNCPVQPR